MDKHLEAMLTINLKISAEERETLLNTEDEVEMLELLGQIFEEGRYEVNDSEYHGRFRASERRLGHL